MNNNLSINLMSEHEVSADTDIAKAIDNLEKEIDFLSSHADKTDCIVAASSGILCGLLDVLWCGEFDLRKGRDIADEEVNGFVEKVAKLFGCKEEGLKNSVAFLEKKFPIPSDGNTPDFGGGLQHHLRDFAHHPTIVGLFFSLLTQFTKKSYGTDVNGKFIMRDVPENSIQMNLIGKNNIERIINGTLIWFFHLVSDMAGSSNTAGISGGTGIPGPILSIAKELSALPVLRNINVGDNSLSKFLSKLFNGTLFAEHDADGHIIQGTELKFDLRGEFGLAVEIGKQAIPVVLNECIVRFFYFIRRFLTAVKNEKIATLSDFKKLDWNNIKPVNSPALDRMLTISTGVFSTLDLAGAVLTEKYFVAVNYVGIGRFAVAINNEMVNFLKIRDVKKIKEMYEEIQKNTYTKNSADMYDRIEKLKKIDKFGLTLEQTEILYNIERYKTINDVNQKTSSKNQELKSEWLEEWKAYMEKGFPDFVGEKTAVLHWYTVDELHKKVRQNSPQNVWFRLVLLEAMLFEPYYALSTETDKKGKVVPCKKYDDIKADESKGDKFLDEFFTESFYKTGFIYRLRKTYKKVLFELNEVLKTVIKSLAITAAVAIPVIAAAGALAPSIAVALVGSNFAGLSGAALTSACLAYLGGGAVALGGMGMAGGTIAIVGGGTILGISVGAGIGGSIGMSSLLDKKNTILQSAKLLVSLREIFLNDEKDIEYSDVVYEQYIQSIKQVEYQLIDMKYPLVIPEGDDKKEYDEQIKNTEESIKVMQIAMKNMYKYRDSFGSDGK